jgi:hypothetical protein
MLNLALFGGFCCYKSLTLRFGTRRVPKCGGRSSFEDYVDFIEDATPISETFTDEQLIHIAHTHSPWFADIVNYLVTGQMPLHWGRQDKSKLMAMVKYFFWDDPYLFKYCPDQIIKRCIPELDQSNVISFCHDHACGGHFSAKKTAANSGGARILTHRGQD